MIPRTSPRRLKVVICCPFVSKFAKPNPLFVSNRNSTPPRSSSVNGSRKPTFADVGNPITHQFTPVMSSTAVSCGRGIVRVPLTLEKQGNAFVGKINRPEQISTPRFVSPGTLKPRLRNSSAPCR